MIAPIHRAPKAADDIVTDALDDLLFSGDDRSHAGRVDAKNGTSCSKPVHGMSLERIADGVMGRLTHVISDFVLGGTMKRMLLLIGLTGCAGAQLTNEENAVRILRKSDPPTNCKEIGQVYSPGLSAITDEGREKNLKRAAFKVGANTVTYDRTDANMTIYGTAFNCPAS